MESWEETSCLLDEDIGYGACHAALHYDDLCQAGPATRPLEFPTPSVYDCEMVSITALDHRTGKTHELKNVIIKKVRGSSGNITLPRHAYMVRKKLCKSVYGSVRLCVVLERRDINLGCPLVANQESADKLVHWESTEQLVVLKASSWSKIRQLRGMHLEDPIREIAAMQHVGRFNPHVLGCIEVMQDENWLYTITPYCSGGDLYGRVMSEGCPMEAATSEGDNSPQVDEFKVRRWFKQLLVGLYHFQRKGVCHRDICLENLLLDDNENLVIVDFGLSLRVPYSDPRNYGCVTDVSEGTYRLLMKSQGQGGHLMYNAPEILERNEAFDGHAIDLWSAGVVLFVLLVGSAPFKWAHLTDKRYEMISNGYLKELLRKLNTSLSPEACDLLQNMMWKDPRDRLTLADVMRHPWVTMDEEEKISGIENKPQKKREWSNSLNSTLQAALGMQKTGTRPSRVLTEQLVDRFAV